MIVSTQIVNYFIGKLSAFSRLFDDPLQHIDCMQKNKITPLVLWSIVVQLRKSEKRSDLPRNGTDWTVYNDPDANGVEFKDRLFFIDAFPKSKKIADTKFEVLTLSSSARRYSEIRYEIKDIDSKINKLTAANRSANITNLTNRKKELEREILLFDLQVKSMQFVTLNTELEKLYLEESTYYRDNQLINSRLITYEEFADKLSKTFEIHGIKTCEQRANFIAQTYHETQRYGTTREKNPQNPYEGGTLNFFGRGLIQLTHDYNYLEYYASVDPSKKKYFNEYMQYRSGTNQGVTEFQENNVKSSLIDDTVIEELKEFSSSISSSIQLSCDAAGWFWEKNKINDEVKSRDANLVSRKINDAETAVKLQLRKDYTSAVVALFDFTKCDCKIKQP